MTSSCHLPSNRKALKPQISESSLPILLKPALQTYSSYSAHTSKSGISPKPEPLKGGIRAKTLSKRTNRSVEPTIGTHLQEEGRQKMATDNAGCRFFHHCGNYF